MKIILIDLFIACLGLSLVAHYVLPDHVASHFGAGGHPDGWMSNGMLTAIMVSSHTLLFVVFLYSSRLLRACPPSIISLPNRDYWLAPERRGHAEDILQRLMMEYGIAMFLFMLLVSGLTLRANLSQPVHLNVRILMAGLLLLLVYTVFWTVKCFRSFRMPAS